MAKRRLSLDALMVHRLLSAHIGDFAARSGDTATQTGGLGLRHQDSAYCRGMLSGAHNGGVINRRDQLLYDERIGTASTLAQLHYWPRSTVLQELMRIKQSPLSQSDWLIILMADDYRRRAEFASIRIPAVA